MDFADNNLPILCLYRQLKGDSPVYVKLQNGNYCEGLLAGFDDFFNLLLRDAKLSIRGTSQEFAQLMLKSDSVVYVGQL